MSERVLTKNDFLPPFEPVNMASTSPSGFGERYPIPPSVDPHDRPLLRPTVYEQALENTYYNDQSRTMSSMARHAAGLGALLASIGIMGGKALYDADQHLQHESALHQQVRPESDFNDPYLIQSIDEGIISGVLIIGGVRIAKGLRSETKQYMNRKAMHLEHHRRYS